MWKKIFPAILLLILLIAGCVYFLLNSTWAAKHLIQHLLEHNLKDTTVESVRLDRQKMVSGRELDFTGLSLVLKQKKDKEPAQTYKLSVERIKLLAKTRDQLHIVVSDAKLENEKMGFSNAAVTLNVKKDGAGGLEIWGDAAVPEAGYAGVQAAEIFAKINGDGKSIKIHDITGRAFDGKWDGDITVAYRPEVDFKVNGTISNFSFEQMKTVNTSVMSKFNGRLSGVINAEGNLKDIRKMSFDMKIAPGGAIDAGLLEFIVYYVPTGQGQQEVMNNLLRSNGKVKVELASLFVENTSPNHLSGIITMKSRELNVNLEIPLEMNIDGKLMFTVLKWEKWLARVYEAISMSFGAFKIY